MIRIITDSACDITQERAKELNITVMPLLTTFGEKSYLDGVDISHDGFFEKLIETDVLPTTSQISPYLYEERFQEVKAQGDTAVCITISSQLSGCYHGACLAAEGFSGIVYPVDSENACIGQRILVDLAVRLREQGLSAAEIAEQLNREKKKIRLIALLDTLEYLKKGGRISAATALAGSLLSIKPVIAVQDGAVTMLGKARGSKNGNNMLKEMINREGPIRFDMPFCLAYSGLSDQLLQKYIADNRDLYAPFGIERLPISTIGSAIGTHVGPGAIAAAFFAP